jgi:hypothetical protein
MVKPHLRAIYIKTAVIVTAAQEINSNISYVNLRSTHSGQHK